MTSGRRAAYIAGGVAAVFALIAIFAHGPIGIVFEVLAVAVWLAIGVGIAANEKRNRERSGP